MRPRLITLLVLLATCTGAAGARGPKLILPLVRAQCPGAVPCLPAFAFRTGAAQLTSAKEPAPSCPKSGKPSETPGGTVQMAGVTRDGAPYTGSLAVEVTNQTTFGSRDCKAGRCSGKLLPSACLPRECIDAPITTEFRLLEVLDVPTLEGGKAIARPGLFVAPGK
jgi:hypothetical protein